VKNKGFTLVELVIVLILIGLSISLAAPSLGRFSKAVELKAGVKKVSAILRYYRSEAVQKGKIYQVIFDPGLREVRIQSVETLSKEGEAEKLEGILQKEKYVIPQGIQMKEVKIPFSQFPSDFPTIEFYPNGGSNGGSFLLDIQNHKGYWILVHFLTGIVEIRGA
jgi:general secretion pathway protein H